ncbi:MAG: methyltransferase domain-containing protein [Candidatus Shapirobacteria bacterium]|jgi:tellurite methyltransferase|nr:methyltransferase domain-containing protein [Candidatus Shapirobacteria bacterium]
MEKYNKTYSVNKNIKPSQILSLIWKNFLSNSKIIDLGCGQGNDSLFLVKNGFLVTAIDSSSVAINQMKVKKDELKLNNLELICDDITNFNIEKDKYQVIICRNVLNFLDKNKALEILNDFKDNIQKDSYIIIEVFTKNDPSFISNNKFVSYFDEQELLNLFSDYEIIYYLENIILDPGHFGFSSPHKHGVARIIAQK